MRNNSPSRGGQQKWTRNNEGFQIRSPQSKEEDLALFHDMRTRENKNFLHPSADDIETALPTKLGGLTGFRISASPTPSWKGNDLLATADSDKTDYDWLLTPPGTPLFPSLDKDSLQSYMDQSSVQQSYSASKGSRFPRSHTPELHRMSRKSPGPQTPPSTASSSCSSQSFSRRRAPSPSRGGSSPTSRPSTPVKTLGRSSTIMNRASTRSSPPVLRRTNTSPSIRSPSTERNAPPPEARTSISPKLQAWQAPELGFSAEPPPNLRTSLSDRPASSTRNGTARPRIGVQEVRHRQEARHSYSDSLESRPSLWRNSSSSASKFSSSTTSQDRWSSRGSVVSSSDDGMETIEHTFLDFSATSPSSTSGASKSFSGRFDNEASSRCSPTLSRQKKSSSSFAETTGVSSASAKKSLEPSMQRVDHHRLSQKMFRPLMSNAPITSYCNVGPTVIRQRPANSLVEPSMTASSNASSERGVRIFPGNESSDEEVQSEWNKSIPKLVLIESEVTDEDYNRMHEHVDQHERESVAENAFSTIDGFETDTAIDVNTLKWARIQTCSELDSLKENQNNRPMSLLKKIVLGSIDHSINEDEFCSNTQQSNANQTFTDGKEDVQKSSAWLHPDSITLHVSHHGQKETEGCDQPFAFNKPYEVDDENCNNAHTKLRIEQAVCSPERARHTKDCYKVEKSHQLRVNPLVIESITSGCIHESIPCYENPVTGLNCQEVGELSLQVTYLEKDADFAEREHETLIVVQDDTIWDTKESPATPASFDSDPIELPMSWHIGSDDSQPRSPMAVAQESSLCQKSTQAEISSFPSSPRSEMQSSPVCQPEVARSQAIGIDELEIKEDEGPDCYSVMTPEHQFLAENEKTFVSDKFSGEDITEKKVSILDHMEDCQFGNVCGLVDSDGAEIKQIDNINLPNNFVLASLTDDEVKISHFHAVIDRVLSSLEVADLQLQDQEYCPIDLVTSMISCKGNLPEGCLAAEACKEGNLPISHDDVISADLQNIYQPPDVSQPDSSYEPILNETGVQDGAVNVTGFKVDDLQGTTTEVNLLNTTEGQQQPQRGSPLETYTNSGQTSATPGFSLEEATNTILFCSSIVHDLLYKAASIATEKEVEAMKQAASLVSQSRGQSANAAFISSLREKVSKSATWKVRHKETKAFTTKLLKEEVSEVTPTVMKCPTPVNRMEREATRVEAGRALPHISKEKSFMGLSVNSNCQCTVM
ncbi:hypothetical protein L7F22_007672 [Adiantum nelumboides]|nr:hypothetical protein [Adiantum nelumboides]